MAKISKINGVETNPGEGMIFIYPGGYNSIGQGTWTFVAGTNYVIGALSNFSGPANGDNFTCKAFLAKGTYSMRVIFTKLTSAGIVDIDIDGSEEASIDTYGGSTTYNNTDTTTGITVAADKLLDVRVRVDGKHGSSSDYKAYIQCIILWRTA